MSQPSPQFDQIERDSPPILRPRPRRPFELPSMPSTPTSDATSSRRQSLDQLRTANTSDYKPQTQADDSATPSRTRSFLNLTGSTLFGIYQGTETENPTPWGTGAQTPAGDHASRTAGFDFTRSGALPEAAFQKEKDGSRWTRKTAAQLQQPRPQKGFKSTFLPMMGRVVALFGVGVLYGVLIAHLHDRQQLAPVQVELNRASGIYLASWGCIGALLGEALPWADVFWAPAENDGSEKRKKKGGRAMDAWVDVVRSIGAFVGIAFAIRRLPWQSTLQLSLTLALANPAIWYLIDRSPPGLILSTIVALSGTAVTMSMNSALIPSPSPWDVLQGNAESHSGINETVAAPSSDPLVLGVFTQESVGIATWIASVLFVSAVCFGNIGRRLAAQRS